MQYTPDLLRSLGIDPSGLRFYGDKIPYDPSLKSYARELRAESVKAEAYLWKILQNKQTGYKFTRQKPILHYIADFYCHELSLVVEIDGSSHNIEENRQYDRRRDREMKAVGLKVVRLWDWDVLESPLTAAGRIFSEVGVEIPEGLRGFFNGSERLWGEGYMGRI